MRGKCTQVLCKGGETIISSTEMRKPSGVRPYGISLPKSYY